MKVLYAQLRTGDIYSCRKEPIDKDKLVEALVLKYNKGDIEEFFVKLSLISNIPFWDKFDKTFTLNFIFLFFGL